MRPRPDTQVESGDDNSNKSQEEVTKKKERSRPVFIPAQPTTRDNSSDQREKTPPTLRPRDDESSKMRQIQPQSRPETGGQDRQERRQEKQERREERREERSNGKKNRDNGK